MFKQQIHNLIAQNLPNTKIYLQGQGCDLTLNIVSDELFCLSAVKRQQHVYQALEPLILSGELHAVNMRFFTQHSWSEQ